MILTACLAFLFTSGRLYSEVEWVPVFQADLLGGQFFFEGEQTSFSGNGNWLFAPGMKFTDRFSLIPTINGKYRRVREVEELIGGGFLTRETLENSAMLKGLLAVSENWKAKLKASFRNQLLVESEDEKLGKGLFDNNKLGAGLELERTGGKLRSLRFSLDPYMVKFIRYSSLVSGTEFGSEIDSGDQPLDFNAYDATVALELLPAQTTLLTGSLLGSYRPFTDQKIVANTGLYTGSKRKDLYGQITLGAAQKLPEFSCLHLQTLIGADFSFSLLDSDQNHYDASYTQFNKNYYDYREYHLAPKLAGKFLNRLDWAILYDYARRYYSERVIQGDDGTYLTDKIYINTHSLYCSFRYPVALGLSLLVQGTYRRSTSNMAYEKTYRYNYNAQHYFTGFSWEY